MSLLQKLVTQEKPTREVAQAKAGAIKKEFETTVNKLHDALAPYLDEIGQLQLCGAYSVNKKQREL